MGSLLQRFIQRTKDWPRRHQARLITRYGRKRARIWWVLLALVILIPILLRFGPGPWDGDLVREISRKAKVDQDAHSTLGTWFHCWWQPGELGVDGEWKWKNLPSWMYGVLGRWWAGLFCWLGCGLLLGTARFWLPRSREVPPPRHAGLTRVPRWAWISLLGALIVALPARLPRMGHSLWHDEIYAGQEYIFGDWEQDEESGAVWLQPKDWEATFSGDRLVNNHMLYSVAARISLETWRLVGGHGPGEWTEWPLRLPSLLAGLATIWLGGWMLARRGRPLSGVLFALILALHPWHAYWSADGRGYSMTLFFVVLVVARLLRCFETGGLWRWVFFGLAEAALLLTYPPMLYLLVVANLLAVAGVLIGRKREGQIRGIQRWIVGNLVGAMLTTLFLAPHVPQFRAYFAKDGWNSMGEMGDSWWADFYSHLFLGQRLASPQEFTVNVEGSDGLSSAQTIEVSHFSSSRADLLEKIGMSNEALQVCIWIVLGVLVLGAFGASRQGWRFPAVLLIPAVGSYLCWAATNATGGYLWTWYLLPLLLSAAWMAALATEAFSRRYRWWVAGPWLVVFTFWAWLGHEQRSIQAHHDRMPLRQAVASVRGKAPLGWFDSDPAVTLFTLGTASGRVSSYDPHVRKIERQKDNLERDGDSRTDLTQLARAEAALGKRSFVLFCAPNLFAQEYPLPWAQLAGPDWRLVEETPGTEWQYSYRVYEFVGL